MKRFFRRSWVRAQVWALRGGRNRRGTWSSLATAAEIVEERLLLSEAAVIGTEFLNPNFDPENPSDVQAAMAAWWNGHQSGVLTITTSGTGTGGGPSVLSDVLTMVTNPSVTATGMISGVGTTFVDGSAADSFLGSVSGLGTTMFGWTGLTFQNTSTWGNDAAFANGQVVGVVWGTTNNIVLAANGIVNLPTLITIVGGGAAVATTGVVVEVGAIIVVSTDAAVAVALGVEGTIALAMGGSDGLPPEQPSETFDNIDDAIGETSLDGSTIVGSEPTGNPNLIDLGFTETYYVVDSEGVQWTVWNNPTTGEFFAHPSSGFRSL